jgi:two-component system nitrogen regulation sensor histidine kinase NtrY
MSFRRKLLLVFALTVFLSVAGVALLVQWLTRNAFEKAENQRAAALVAQFQREFTRRGDDVARRVDAIATSDPITRMATALNGTSSDFAEYFDLARAVAENHQLDFLEILDGRGTIVSSAQWPTKFGYPEPAFASLSAANQDAFLKLEELQDSTALGFFAVRSVRGAGDHLVYIIGGRRLDKNFLSALDLPAETRVLLYQNRGDHFSPDLLLEQRGLGPPCAEVCSFD